MQFSEQWLRSYVNPSLDSEALAHLLTMAGLEVEEIQSVAQLFSQVVVAKILRAEKHPDADRLQVCTVDVGADMPLQIVCGAPNARAGLLAPCALVGAKLPGFDIRQAKVRGVESFGMMCSATELGLSEESSGLLELSQDATVGQDIRTYLDLNDQKITLKLTPNRSDCLSLLGIAREVSALTGEKLCFPSISPASIAVREQRSVQVQATTACPRYTGRLIKGVNASVPTPEWIIKRLERSGIRSISAIVDVTNYVLLEMGQPLHAFDAAKLQGGIQVRFAHADEALTLLNQQVVKLDTDMLVIADDSTAVALAGIMGGAATAVSDDTQDIFLESAFFLPDAIAGKARKLGLSTDSSYRFERGVDFGNTLLALERATELIQSICGGDAGPVTEVQSQLPVRVPVRLNLQKLVSVLGIPVEAKTVACLFDRLGFVYQQAATDFEVTPPSYRFDINIEEDLIEEIARLHGYDNVPALAPQDIIHMLPANEAKLSSAWLRDAMVGYGYQEVVNYSFVDASWERDLLGNAIAIPLKNPIASNMSVMRSGLWGGLLDTLTYNLNRKQERVRVFEVGTSYAKVADGKGYQETLRISALAYGSVIPEQWAGDKRDVDFFDLKAEVNALTNGRAEYVVAQHPALHPGQSAQVWLDGRAIGWLGKLHPKWQQHYQLPKNTILFELDVSPLLNRTVPSYAEIAKFPPVRRDLAVVVDAKIPAGDVLKAMQDAKIPYVYRIGLFDVYQGKGIAEGKKSLAFLVLMQDTQKTLTDAESDSAVAALLETVVSRYGAELRK